MSGDIFDCHSWGEGAGGIQWVEARGVVKHLTRHRANPTTNNSPAQSVNSSEVENPTPDETLNNWRYYFPLCL